ncbi:MAG: EamA family transporter [Solirubrobacteraceae bacterium]
MSTTTSPGPLPAGAPAPGAPAGAPDWQIWTALWIVYLIWGSTYLAIRVTVETVPPFLSAGARFGFAGAAMLAFLAVRRGTSVLRPTREQLLSCLAVGTLLMGANAVVSVAEVEVPSRMAALLIASVPLWVILYRRGLGERVAGRSVAAVLVGFAGVGLLLLPGKQTGGASLIGLLAVVAAAVMWAGGSVASQRVRLPREPFVSGAWQMLLGGGVCALTGALAGEFGDLHPAEFSLRSVAGLAYLVVFGSWIAFTSFAWLLQNAPVSRVATYAYVNPIVAIALGWAILDEAVTTLTFAGAAIIVASVAAVVRTETRRSNPR